MVKLYQKEKKIEMSDSVLLDLKDFMTNLLNRTTCTVLGVETVFLKRNSAYSETVKGPCMCLSLKK